VLGQSCLRNNSEREREREGIVKKHIQLNSMRSEQLTLSSEVLLGAEAMFLAD